MSDIELAYAKTFAGNMGQRVLAHMRKITIERVLGPMPQNQNCVRWNRNDFLFIK